MIDSATINKLGYWLVDGKHKFINKNVALEHCTKNKTKDIRYCLEEDRFGKINWHNEPTLSLTELYKLRAQQIRDNYDHVVLTYSGGSDSTNILHSFIANGIKPNEVISFMLEGKDFSNEGTTFNKEITFNQNAIKQYVLSNNIKYSTVNISDFYNSIFDNEHWCYESGVNRAYITARAHAAKLDRFKKLVDSGKKYYIMYGLEKPSISVDKNNNFYSFFLDIPLQQYNLNEMYNNSYNGLTLERFYVSGDLPELTIKQSHIVANYYQQQFQKESKKMLQLGFEYDFRDYKEIVIDLLYSHSFDQKKCFTIGKSNYLAGLRDDWLVSLSNNDRRKMNVFNGWTAISKNIDKSFFNKNNWQHDTVGCISTSYYLNKKI